MALVEGNHQQGEAVGIETSQVGIGEIFLCQEILEQKHHISDLNILGEVIAEKSSGPHWSRVLIVILVGRDYQIDFDQVRLLRGLVNKGRLGDYFQHRNCCCVNSLYFCGEFLLFKTELNFL